MSLPPRERGRQVLLRTPAWEPAGTPSQLNRSPAAIASLQDCPSLRAEIVGALRAALVAGQMHPGQVYSVPMLAAQFGVSATPVREAMLDLAKEGLVEAARNKGFRVTEPTEQELDDITELRMLIEVPSVAALARTADPAALERLRPLAEQIVVSARAGDLLAYIEADRCFHLKLLQMSGNAELVQIVATLRGRTRLYGLTELHAQGVLVDSAREHDELLDALLSGDPQRSEGVMARHIGHTRGIWARPASETPSAMFTIP